VSGEPGNATVPDRPPVAVPRVIVVILNTNRRADTLACLASLALSTYPAQEIVVVDNASTDGSLEAVGSAFPAVHTLPLAENRGYAGNNNAGIAWALEHGAEWVLVLNEDTVLAPDCVARLVEAGESGPRVGIVGPTVYHFDEPTVIQSAGGNLSRGWLPQHRGQNQADTGQFAAAEPVDWLSGCGLLVRRALIEQVGVLDERFFIYWEEVDWCLRAARAGWRLLHAPQARLWHKGVQRHYHPAPGVTYYSTRNRLLLLAKHHAPLGVRLAAVAALLRTLASWTLRPKWRHLRPHRDAMLRGLSDFARHRWGKQRQ
jgi:GT2 family glycosyltransferase